MMPFEFAERLVAGCNQYIGHWHVFSVWRLSIAFFVYVFHARVVRFAVRVRLPCR